MSEFVYDDEGFAGPPPKEKPPRSKMTKEEKEYWKQVGHLHEDKPHEPYILPDVKTPKEQQQWVTQNTIWNKDSRYCTGRCGSQCEGGYCRDSGCPSLKISCAVPIRSPNEPTSTTITSPPWKLQKQHPTTSDSHLVNPAHEPANRSPIDNVVQGIGDWWNNLIHQPKQPIGVTIGPQPIAPQIGVPVGFARQQKKIPQNVPYSTWAPQMWKQFDDLGNNFKSSQDFASSVHSLIDQIPCPECKTDGESYVKSHPPESVTSKAAAQGWVKQYHSHVDSVAKGWGRDDPWFSTMWAELHYRADHFNEITFADQVRHQIDQIPCPPCSTHSLEFMERNPPENVHTRDQAMYWMCSLHNMASYYAGNEIVDCSIDPEGYGYLSGHRDYPNDFFYGGGSRGGGGGKGRGGHQHGGQQQGGRGGRGGHGHHGGQGMGPGGQDGGGMGPGGRMGRHHRGQGGYEFE